MFGYILHYSVQTGEGAISGDDGARYSFAGGDWRDREPPTRGDRVEFAVLDGRAASVSVTVPAYRRDQGPQRGFAIAVGCIAVCVTWIGALYLRDIVWRLWTDAPTWWSVVTWIGALPIAIIVGYLAYLSTRNRCSVITPAYSPEPEPLCPTAISPFATGCIAVCITWIGTLYLRDIVWLLWTDAPTWRSVVTWAGALPISIIVGYLVYRSIRNRRRAIAPAHHHEQGPPCPSATPPVAAGGIASCLTWIGVTYPLLIVFLFEIDTPTWWNDVTQIGALLISIIVGYLVFRSVRNRRRR